MRKLLFAFLAIAALAGGISAVTAPAVACDKIDTPS
jgi:hypothetical protein